MRVTPRCESRASDRASTRRASCCARRRAARASSAASASCSCDTPSARCRAMRRATGTSASVERAGLLRPEMQGDPLMPAADDHRQDRPVARLRQLRGVVLRFDLRPGRIRHRRDVVDDAEPAVLQGLDLRAVDAHEERAVIVRERVGDQRPLAVVQRHRQAVVPDHGLDDRGDLREDLPDVEHRSQEPEQLLGYLERQHACTIGSLCHEVCLSAQSAPRGTHQPTIADKSTSALNH